MRHPYLSREHPIRFAHRGSRILWPENTLTAFQGAVDLGCVYIETDVRITQDDVVVVFHDATLERVTNGAGLVREWRFEELRRLDAAYRFDPARGYPLRGTGIGIASLEEVLLTWPDVHFNLDIKGSGMEWHVAEVIRRLDREDSTLIGSFHEGRLFRYRRIMGSSVATSAGPFTAGAMWLASRVGRSLRSPVVAYQLPFDSPARIDARLVAAVHAAGAQLHVWTVNGPSDMERLLDLGVDGIVTDRPDELTRITADRADRGSTGQVT